MKFIRYVAVQILAYGLDMGSFLIVSGLLGLGPIIANILGKIVAGIFAFFAHRSFTFAVANENKHAHQTVMYFLLLALNVPLSSVALSLVLLVCSPPVFAKFIADVFCVFITYWLSKKYVFPGNQKRALDSTTQGRNLL